MSIFGKAFDEAVLQGTWSGLVSGFYSHGLLLDEAKEFLSREKYDAKPGKEAGIRDGLVETGLLKRNLFLRYRRTEKPVVENWPPKKH